MGLSDEIRRCCRMNKSNTVYMVMISDQRAVAAAAAAEEEEDCISGKNTVNKKIYTHCASAVVRQNGTSQM